MLFSLLCMQAFPLAVVSVVRPQWDVQTFEDMHDVRQMSNLQQRLFSLRGHL